MWVAPASTARLRGLANSALPAECGAALHPEMAAADVLDDAAISLPERGRPHVNWKSFGPGPGRSSILLRLGSPSQTELEEF